LEVKRVIILAVAEADLWCLPSSAVSGWSTRQSHPATPCMNATSEIPNVRIAIKKILRRPPRNAAELM
jgi:hypothetical protein